MKDRARYAKNMAGLGEVFDREVSPALAEIYWRVLGDLSDDVFEAACGQAARTLKFWPKPAELLALAQPDPEAEALGAWHLLEESIGRVGPYRSVQFRDPRLSRAVELLGGWIEVCRWRADELPFRRAEFVRGFKALSPGGESEVFPGLVDLSNAAGGYGRPSAPVMIGAPPAVPQVEAEPRTRALLSVVGRRVDA